MRAKQRFFPPPGYTPKVYGYGRVSHPSQMGAGIDANDPTGSIPDQETRIRAYYELQSRPGMALQGTEWGGMHSEPRAQSAYAKHFHKRPAGEKLIELLEPGDHLIVDKLDRVFRDTEDFVLRRRYFIERGIRLHFVNFMGMSGDLNSRGAKLLLQMMVSFAETESENTSERICLARSALRASGKDAGTPPPFFCRFEGTDQTKTRGHTGKLVMHDWALPLMEKIAYLRDHEGLGYHKIVRVFMQDKTEPKLQPPQIRKLYEFFKAWDATGRPDINTLKVSDFVRTYWNRVKANGHEEAA